jgi:hypothetical protein
MRSLDLVQSHPLIAGEVMFLTGPENEVMALHAGTGEQLWVFRRPITVELTLCWGFRRRRTLIPKGTRTAFRAEGEQYSERSDAGISIVREVFVFVKRNLVRSVAEEQRR